MNLLEAFSGADSTWSEAGTWLQKFKNAESAPHVPERSRSCPQDKERGERSTPAKIVAHQYRLQRVEDMHEWLPTLPLPLFLSARVLLGAISECQRVAPPPAGKSSLRRSEKRLW